MDKKTKTIVGVLAIAGLGYWFYMMKNKPKPAFANLTAKKKNCKTYSGDVSAMYVGTIVGGGTVTATGNGTTTICY